ncbi:MAG: hypothetical protein IJ494_09850 [Bacteroides sp.]|nr:hypothetical protein [Bacteroides sp.]
MANIKQGLLGGVSGRVGNVIGFRRRGKDLLRVQATHINDAKSPRQLKQREKMSTVMDFLSPIMPFIRIGYRNYAQGRAAYNMAVSYLVKRCMEEGTDGENCLNLQRTMVSIGFLNGVTDAVLSRQDNLLTVIWSDNGGTGNAESSDNVMLLVYNPVRKESTYLLAAATRGDEKAQIKIPQNWQKDNPVVYLTFAAQAEDGEVSNSIFLK